MYSQIENFLTKEFSNLKDIVVLKLDNCYQLFNRYVITEDKQGNFILDVYNRSEPYTFHNLQNAVAWCIYDNQSKYTELKQIHYLDNKLGSLETSIQIYKKMLSQAKTNENKNLYLVKLGEDVIKKKQVQKELSKYIRTSRIWQQKKFLEKQPK